MTFADYEPRERQPRPALNVGTAQRRDGDNPDTIQSQEQQRIITTLKN